MQGQKISWWEGHKGLAFLQDVRLIDGELVVPCPGLYYIYAQTYFRHTHPGGEEGEEEVEEEREQRGRPMLQYVYKKVSSQGQGHAQGACRHETKKWFEIKVPSELVLYVFPVSTVISYCIVVVLCAPSSRCLPIRYPSC